MNNRIFLTVGLLCAVGLLVACAPSKDPCDSMELPFYCAGVLYDSGRQPESLEDARDIVLEYVTGELELKAEVLSAAQSPGSSPWYQITCRFSDGTENGFDVGSDGKIYTVKYRH